MNNKKARSYSSSLINDLLSQIPESEKQLQLEKMRLAAKIDEARKAKGWSKSEFAKQMNVTNAVITKWLSGTQNLTSENLIKIGLKLDIILLDTNPKDKEVRVTLETRYISFDKLKFTMTQLDFDSFFADQPSNIQLTPYCI